jgi:MSHA biogenesis protein MshM
MYLEHFGFAELPFTITPDTAFLYAADGHQAALNTVLLALKSGEGFVKITGEVGTGKTLLCRRLLKSLGEDYVTAYVPNPKLESATLLRALLEELGVDHTAITDEYHLIKALNEQLMTVAAGGKTVVICLDEAQAIPVETLETVRLLSNLETEKQKLLQLVLLGQPELDTHLADPSIRQLRQRIAFQYRMPMLRRDELRHYLAHRSRIAGYRGDHLFSQASARCLHRATRGTPRLVNILAHKSLLCAFGEGEFSVAPRHVAHAVRDTEGLRWQSWWRLF